MATTANPLTKEEIVIEEFSKDMWCYARNNSRSLDSQRHIEWIRQRADKCIKDYAAVVDEMRRTTDNIQWVFRTIDNGKKLFDRSNAKQRNTRHDAEIIERITKRGVTYQQAARAFSTSVSAIRNIMRENGYRPEDYER